MHEERLVLSTFIGLKAEIVNSSHRGYIGLRGAVVDETKNLLVIEAEGGREVRIPKASSTFRFFLPGGSHADIEGKKIAFRPHERPKKA